MAEPKKAIFAFVIDQTLKHVVGYLLLGFIALVAYLLTPVGERMKAIWDSPETIAANRDMLLEILNELGSQREVVDWSRATHMSGPCRRGHTCTLVARFRRVDGAEDCRIIAGTGRFALTSYEDFIPRNMVVVDGQTRNIGRDYETAEIVLRTPRSVPLGEGELRVTTNYNDCPWQRNGEPPVSQISDAIPVVIVE